MILKVQTQKQKVKASEHRYQLSIHQENTEIHKEVATWSSLPEQSGLCGKHSCRGLGSPDGEDEAGILTPQAWVCLISKFMQKHVKLMLVFRVFLP